MNKNIIDFKDFFEQAESPQNGDIAVYQGAHVRYGNLLEYLNIIEKCC